MHAKEQVIVLLTLCLLVFSSCQGNSAIVDEPLDEHQPPLITVRPDGPNDWMMPRGSSANTGYFNWEGPADAEVTFTAKQGDQITVLGESANGILYAYQGSNLVAFDQDLQPLWSYACESLVRRDTFSIGGDSTARFFDTSARVHVVHPDGSHEEVINTGAAYIRCCFDDLNRAYYCYSQGDLRQHVVVALDLNGGIRWQHEFSFTYQDGMSLASRAEYIYVLDADDILHQLNQDGTTAWTYDTEYDWFNDVFLSRNGYCYVTGRKNESEERYRLRLINPQGELLWDQDAESHYPHLTFSQAPTGPYDEFYATPGNILTRYNTDGSTQELHEPAGAFSHIDADGYFHFYNHNYPSEYSLLSPQWEYTDYPDLLLDASKYHITVGPHRRIYGYYDSTLRAYDLADTAVLAWEYESAVDPIGITVNTKGEATVITKLELLRYGPAGVRLATAPLPDELTNKGLQRYFGQLRGNDQHIVTTRQLVYAVDSQGAIAWYYDVGGHRDPVCTLADDRVVVTFGPNLALLDATGAEVFKVIQPKSRDIKYAAVDDSGQVYCVDGSMLPLLAAYTPAGELRWSTYLDATYPTCLASTLDGRILVLNRDKLLCFDEAGDEVWSFSAATEFYGSLGVSPQGHIYLAQLKETAEYVYLVTPDHDARQVSRSSAFDLLILNSSGELQKTVKNTGNSFTDPMVDSQGNVYFMNSARDFTSVNPTGEIVFDVSLRDYAYFEYSLYESNCYLAPSPQGGFVFAGPGQFTIVGT